jgi:ABC-type amino acid transport substrate-binding protein
LNNAFSQAIAVLHADGTLAAIMERYGLSGQNLAIWPKKA